MWTFPGVTDNLQAHRGNSWDFHSITVLRCFDGRYYCICADTDVSDLVCAIQLSWAKSMATFTWNPVRNAFASNTIFGFFSIFSTMKVKRIFFLSNLLSSQLLSNLLNFFFSNLLNFQLIGNSTSLHWLLRWLHHWVIQFIEQRYYDYHGRVTVCWRIPLHRWNGSELES